MDVLAGTAVVEARGGGFTPGAFAAEVSAGGIEVISNGANARVGALAGGARRGAGRRNRGRLRPSLLFRRHYRQDRRCRIRDGGRPCRRKVPTTSPERREATRKFQAAGISK
jgi:hypothetical protein